MISIEEQSQLTESHVAALGLHDTYAPMPIDKLALNRGNDGCWWASYYIGLTEINGKYVEVLPKLENLDFMALFSYALMYQPSSDYFSSCYDIRWNEETYASSDMYDILTPLLVMQYLNILEKLVGKGLKRDYQTIQENIHAKIKGKLKPILHWRKNGIKKKEDHFYCQYQVYTADIPVNRLLKKALDISFQLLGNVRAKSCNMNAVAFLSSKLKIRDAFKDISNNIHPESIRNYKFDKLNMHYSDAIKLAKQIIRHEDNALKNNSGQKRVPLFWIDMARLYEVYVLGILQSKYPLQIRFQQKGSYGTQCDYIHIGESIVLDAKYKPWYSSYSGRCNHVDSLIADIREISGYARDEKLLQMMDECNSSPICVIVHPDDKETNLNMKLADAVKNDKIEGYRDFYRLRVSLPRFK